MGLSVISLGLGVQSTALYYMSSTGQLPRVDYAIFSDLGKEGEGTYKYLDYLLDWQKKNAGIPIIVRKEKNLFKDLLNRENSTGQRFASIPAFTKNDDGTTGMLRRQCTNEYKIQVVDNAIRDLYGLKTGDRRPSTDVWQGITLDELQRMTIPQDAWKTIIYPFVGYATNKKQQAFKIEFEHDYRKTRADIYGWYFENKLPIPPKSACIFCPFQADARWHEMKKNQPDDFKAAVKIDEAIRNSSKKGIKQPIYLHDSCKPLKEVQFNPQSEFQWGNCSDVCHI